MLGYAVLSEAEALEGVGEKDEADPLWIAAIVLMILGAIYAGKLAMMTTSCCLKRLQGMCAGAVDDGGVGAISMSPGPVQASGGTGPVQDLSSGGAGPVQASTSDSVGASGPVQASTSFGAQRDGPVQALSSHGADGSGPEQASSSSNGAALNGPVQALAASNGPEQALAASNGPEQARAASNGPAQALAASNGPEQALASSCTTAASSSAAAVALSVAAVAASASDQQNPVQHAAEVRDGRIFGGLHNPWNLFQHEHRGKGWSPAKMSSMYQKWRRNQG